MKTIKKFLTGAFATAMTASVAYTPVLATETKSNYLDSVKDGIVIVKPESNGKWMETAGKYWYRYNNGSYIHANAPEESVIYVDLEGKGVAYAFDANGWMLTGWFKDKTGWHFADSTGAVKHDGWLSYGGSWYFFVNGKMAEDALVMQNVDSWDVVLGEELAQVSDDDRFSSTWYYVGKDGKMATGWVHPADMNDDAGNPIWMYCLPVNGRVVRDAWVQTGGNWYYLLGNGFMVRNANINGYWVNDDGIWSGESDGWKQNSTGWWYSLDGTYVADKFLTLNDGTYYLNREGYMITGWAQLGSNEWYYFAADGKMQTGWVKVSGDWYYFNDNGKLATELSTVTSKDGAHIYYLENGKLVKSENA